MNRCPTCGHCGDEKETSFDEMAETNEPGFDESEVGTEALQELIGLISGNMGGNIEALLNKKKDDEEDELV